LSNLTLSVEILGEFKKLTQATTGAQTSLGKLNTTAQKISSGMSKAFGAIGISLGAVAFVNFTKNAIRAAEEVEVADKRLNQVAKSMNLFGDDTAKVTARLSKMANQTELLTGVTAETTKQIQSTLMTFGGLAKSADEVDGAFDRATKAAIDLAAAGFGNATSNAIQLGKALNDPIKGLTSLTKSGVTFTESERERIKVLVETNRLGEAQALILAAIETQVGGTAAATVTSSAKMQAAFGQIEDAVGLALLPVLEKFSTWLATNEGQEVLQRIADVASDLFGQLADTAAWAIANKDWLLPLAGAAAIFTATAKAIGLITTAIGAAKVAQEAFNASAYRNPYIIALGAVAGIAAMLAAINSPSVNAEADKIIKSKDPMIMNPNQVGRGPGYVPPVNPGRPATGGSVNITVNTPKITAQEITNLVNTAQKNGYTGQITFPRQ
jgi:hypothetical protein